MTDVAIGLALPVLWYVADEIASRLQHPQLLHWVHVISYASFAAYLIHRLTFHLGQVLYNPTTVWGSLLYWMGIMLPLTFITAYGFQRLYDRVML